MGMRMGLHGREWVCMDESLEREMGMRNMSGSEGYVHGNGNGLAWTGMGLHR